jgi:4'-phosphopantetheinyl transferase
MNSCFKEFTPAECMLTDTRIDIWEFPLHTEFTKASALLSNDETTRARRFHFARHQRRYTVARAMLRLILAHYLQLSPAKLEFTYNSHGKPGLSDSPLEFNLSHSGE